MTRFTEKANAITPNRELQPDEYFNETDHLIYCSKCNTPRQCRHELQGKVLIPSIRCKCQQEIFEQEETQRKLHEKQIEIEHLKTSGLQDKALYDYTFARDNGINPEIKLAHNYVSNWEEMKANASGLLIWGDVGTGKSFFAGCIANALLEKGVPVLMTNFSRILNTLTVMHFEDRNQFINSLNRYSLLIIDDLGIERNSDFALEQVFNVIDCRYRSKKPLIITTNLTLSELNNAADIAHKRIYDRILERCIPVRINNRNIRQDNASANLKEAKKILLSNPDLNQN
uniref:ATP-binding protein n=1 Tax=Mediterraneibacter gnavus TaxID=33038 RepID=UPI0040270797